MLSDNQNQLTQRQARMEGLLSNQGVFSSSQITKFDTMQKEDFSSHQIYGTCMEY